MLHGLETHRPNLGGLKIAQINKLAISVFHRVSSPAIDDVTVPSRLPGTGRGNEGEVATVGKK
jgi:hypothetical protein